MYRQISLVRSILATHCIFRTVVNYLQVNFLNAGIVLCSSESTKRQKAKYKNTLADIPQGHALTLIHKVKQKRFTRSTNVAILCICNDDLPSHEDYLAGTEVPLFVAYSKTYSLLSSPTAALLCYENSDLLYNRRL